MPNPFILRDIVLPHDECPWRAVLPEPRDRQSRSFHSAFLFVPLLLCAICTSCGAVGSSAPTVPTAPVTVSVAASLPQVFPGETDQFTATMQDSASASFTWQVNGVAPGNSTYGTINSSGLYVAPASVPNQPSVIVTAIAQSDSNISGSATVTILPVSAIQSISLTPALSSVTPSQELLLTIVPSAVSNADVTWSVDGIANGSPAVGTFSTAGTASNSIDYVPPQTSGSHTITATVNHGATASATVAVTTFAGTLTWRNDNSRSGINSQELLLSPSKVSALTFGGLFSCPLAPNEYPYAQPLYVPNLAIPGMGIHNVVFVATEMDSVYAFDADTSPCVQLWQKSLIPPGSQAIATPNQQITTSVIVPFIGITGTPVIDLNASLLYVVAASQTIAENPIFSEQLYALDLATGRPEILPSGAPITSPSGETSVFYPGLENQRGALLLDNGTVYVAFGSYGGQGDYHGWLFAYNSTTMQQTGIFDVTPDAIQGGIWQSGGGPSADPNGNVFVVTGSGPFDVYRGGMSYSDSFLRFGPASGLTVSDYFTPCDQATDQAAGLDVGASAPVLLPPSAGSSSQSDLLIGGAENGSLYVVNRDDMGGYVVPCPDSSVRVQTIPVGAGPITSTPLFWNNAVYVAPGDGSTMNGYLLSFPMSGGELSFSPSASQSPETLGPQGATPVISANGTSNAILWLIDSSGAQNTPNTPAILRAYDPDNLSNEIYSSPAVASSPGAAGLAVKFTVPTVANGKVYVGTQSELDVYGLLQ